MIRGGSGMIVDVEMHEESDIEIIHGPLLRRG
jgi:hypothetical protein